MADPTVTISVGIELLDGQLDAGIKDQVKKIQDALSKIKFDLNFSSSNKFLQNFADAFTEALETLQHIKREMNDGVKVKLDIDDEFVAEIRKQLIGAFQEALSKNRGLATTLGDDIAKEVRRGVTQGLAAGKNAAKKSQSGSPTTERDSLQASQPAGTKISGNQADALFQEFSETFKQFEIVAKRSRATLESQLGGMAEIIKRTTGEASKAARSGGAVLQDGFASLTSAASKTQQKNLKDTQNELVQLLGRLTEIQNAYKNIDGGDLRLNELLGGDVGESIRGIEEYLQKLKLIDKTAQKSQSLRARILRDTKQTYQFLTKSARELAGATSSGDVSALRAINVEHRSLGQKLSREIVHIQEQLNGYIRLEASAARRIKDAKTELALETDLTRKAELRGTIKNAEGEQRGYQQNIEAAKELSKEVSNQRIQVEAQVTLNRSNIRVLEEEQRLREASLRKVIQTNRTLKEQRRQAGEIITKAGQRADAPGASFNTEEASRIKSLYSDINESINRQQQALRQIGGDYHARIAELEAMRDAASGVFEGLKPDEANDLFERIARGGRRIIIKLAKDINQSLTESINVRSNLEGSGALEQVVKTEEADAAGKSLDKVTTRFEELRERMLAFKKATTSEELQDLALNMKAVRGQQDGLVKDTDKLVATLARLRQTGSITDQQYKERVSIVRQLRKEMGELGSSNGFNEVKDQVRNAGVAKFLRDDLGDATNAVERFQREYEKNLALFGTSPAATQRAAAGFSRIRSEAASLEGKLAQMADEYLQAQASGVKFDAALEAQAKTLRQTISNLGQLNSLFERQKPFVDNAAKSAKRAGLGFQLYNQELAGSIVQNLKFINAMTIVTSVLFAVRAAIFELLEESKAFARTLTVLQSKTLSITESFEKFKSAARETAIEFGSTITEVSEVVKQFGSAGLTTEESLGALRNTMRLIIATSADAEEVTRAVAGVYNVFGQDMAVLGDEFAAFARITDTLTSVYRNHQAELDEVVQGLRFSSAAGRAAGFTFEEVSAYLAVLNDNLIKSGAAGRGLQVVFAQLANKSDQIAKAFNIELDQDVGLNEQFLGFLEELNRQTSSGALTVAELEKQFSIFGLRGARSAITLVKNIDQVKEAIDEMNNSQGTAAELSDLVQSQLANSFERGKQALLDLLRDAIEPLVPAFTRMVDAITAIRDGFQSLPAIGPYFGTLLLIVGGVVAAVQAFLAVLRVSIFVTGSFGVSLDAVTVALGLKTVATKADTAAAIENAGAVGAQAAANTKGSVAMTGMLAGLKKSHVALALVLTLLPAIVAGFSSFSTTVQESEQALARLDSEFGQLNRRTGEINKFQREFTKAAAKIKDDTFSIEARVKLLRATVNNYGSGFIDSGEIMSRSSEELINNFSGIEESLKRQIELEKELTENRSRSLNLRKNEAQDQKFRSTFIDQNGDGAIDLKGLNKQRKAIEDLSKSFERNQDLFKSFGSNDGLLSGFGGFGDQVRNLISRNSGFSLLFDDDNVAALDAIAGLNDTVRADIERLLANNDQDGAWEALFNALGNSFTQQVQTASKTLNETLSHLEVDDQRQRVLNALFDEDLLLKDAEKWQKSLVDFYLKAYRKSVKEINSALSSQFIPGPLDSALSSYRDTFDGLQTAVDGVTFERWADAIDDSVSGAVRVEQEVKSLLRLTNGPSYDSSQLIPTPGAIGVPENAFRKEIILPQLKDLSPDVAKALLDKFAPELANKVALLPDEIDKAVSKYEDGQIKLGLTPDKSDLEEYAKTQYSIGLENLSKGLVAGLRAAGPAIENELGEILIDSNTFASYLTDVNKELGTAGQSFSNVTDKLVELRRTNLFERTEQAIAKIRIETLISEGENRKVQNSYTKLALEVQSAQQKLNALQETGEIGAERLVQLQKDYADAITTGAREFLKSNSATADNADEILESSNAQRNAAVEYAAATKEVVAIEEKLTKIIDAQVNLSQKQVELAKERVARLAEAANLRRAADSASKQLKNELSIEIDRRDTIRTQLSGLRAQLKVAQQLEGSGIAVLEAQNQLRDVKREQLTTEIRIRELFYEQSFSRDDALATAHQLLDVDNKLAGVNFEISSIRKQAAIIEREILRIQTEATAGRLDEVKLIAEMQTQFENYVDLFDKVRDIQDRLKKSEEGYNDILSLRAGILRDIFGVYNEEQSKIEADLGTALDNAFNTDPLFAAQAAARELGINFDVALERFSDLKGSIIEGMRQGSVSTTAFGADVAGIASSFKDVQGEADGVNERLRGIQNSQIARFTDQFNSAFGKKNISDAREAISALQGVLNERYTDPRERVAALENLEAMARRLQELQASVTDDLELKVKFIIDTSGFDLLEKRLRELADVMQANGFLLDSDLGALSMGQLVGALAGSGYLQTDQAAKLGGYKTGGRIPGYGGGDSVPAMLEPGEFVIPKEAVKALGPNFFEQFRGYQDGGLVGFDFTDLSPDESRQQVYDLYAAVAKVSPAFQQILGGAGDLSDVSFIVGEGRGREGTAGSYNYRDRSLTVNSGSRDRSLASEVSSLSSISEFSGDISSLYNKLSPVAIVKSALAGFEAAPIHELVHKNQTDAIISQARLLETSGADFSNGDLFERYYLRLIKNGMSSNQFVSEFVGQEVEAELKSNVVKIEVLKAKMAEAAQRVNAEMVTAASPERLGALSNIGNNLFALMDVLGTGTDKGFAEQLTAQWFDSTKDVYIGSGRSIFEQYSDLLSSGSPLAIGLRSGGTVPGTGSGDIVPAMLEPGEFVIPKKTVQALGVGYFEQFRGYQLGGEVGSNPNVIPTGRQGKQRALGLFLSPGDKKTAEALSKIFADELEAKLGNKNFVADLVENIGEGFKKVFSGIVSFLDFDFILAGAAQIGAAFEQFNDTIESINDSFEATITQVEQSLSRNQTDFLSFIDSVQDAELQRYAARAAAEQALREEMIKTRAVIVDSFKGSATSAIDGLKSTLDSLTPSIKDVGRNAQDAIASLVPLADSATANKISKAKLFNVVGSKPVRSNFAEGDAGAAKFEAAVEKYDTAVDDAQQKFKKSSEDYEKLRRVNSEAVARTIGSGVLSVLGGGLSLLLSGLSKAVSLLADPKALQQTIDGLKAFVADFTANAGRYVTDLLQSMDELVSNLVEALPEILATIVEELPRLLTGLLDTLKTALPEIIKALGAALPDLIRALVPLVADIIVVLLDNIPYIIQAVVSALPVLIFEVVKALPKLLLALLKAQVEIIIGLVTGIIGGIIEIFVPGFMKEVFAVFSDIKSFFTSVFDTILGLFRKLTEEEKEDRDQARRSLSGSVGTESFADTIQRANPKNPFFKTKYFRTSLAVAGFKDGGQLAGYGGGDIIPAMLEPGEFVMPKEVVRSLGPDFFEGLRTSGDVSNFRYGGIVGGTGGFNSRAGSSMSSSISQTNNIGFSIDGNASTEQKRQTAQELVDFIDEELEKKRRNRNLKFGG